MTYKVDMMSVLIGSFQQCDVWVTSQMVHDLDFAPHVFHILCRPAMSRMMFYISKKSLLVSTLQLC